jgi:simple sugar transport system ATP-binding protein
MKRAPGGEAALRLADIDKRFGAVHAVKGASLDARYGAVLAVCGENGAGKSTLLKIGAGVLAPDAGRVLVDGAPLEPHSAREAIRRGVGMVQQHFALVGPLTALENVVLGVEPTRGGRLDLAAARAKLAPVLRDLDADVELDARVETLGVGDRQRLEIARTLYRDARVVVLDEPTAVLTPAEAKALYATLRRLADAGRAVIVVTHKLDEVRDHADEVLVLRRGERVLARPLGGGRAEVMEEIASAIMGGSPPAVPSRKERTRGEVVLDVGDVVLGRALRGVSLRVASGEIVGVAGVEGNGQRELALVLGGLVAPDAGAVRGGPAVVVHEDRHHEGLVLDATVRDNLVLGDLGRFARRGLLDTRALDAEARRRFEHAAIKGSLDDAARALSGGNQQKVVLARALARGGKALVLSHPTRGVDVGASRAIHGDILGAAERGAGVVVVSADLSELRALADRILVMAKGRIAAELPPTATDDEIGRAMLSLEPRARAAARQAGSAEAGGDDGGGHGAA